MKNIHYLQKELYALLQKDMTIFEFLQAGSLDGLWYWDLENPEHEWMNSRFWEILGYDPNVKEHLAKEWQNIIDQEDLKTALSNFEAHCKDPNVPYDQIVRYTHNNGHTVWIRCRGIAIRDEEGKPIRMLGAHNDITSLKESEVKLLEKMKLLQSANRDLKQYTSTVTHDLKAPIRTIKSFTELLRKELGDELPERASTFMDFIESEASRTQQLIEDLHRFATTPREAKDCVNVDTQEVLEQVAQSIFVDLEEKKGALTANNLPPVRSHPTLVSQVFQNLVSNAVKFCKEGQPPRVKIEGYQEGKWCTFSVQDNGIGIAPEHQSHIFDLFHRLHEESLYEGTGVGLSIVQRIVESHGGSLWVESISGEGSTFKFTLPSANEEVSHFVELT